MTARWTRHKAHAEVVWNSWGVVGGEGRGEVWSLSFQPGLGTLELPGGARAG